MITYPVSGMTAATLRKAMVRSPSRAWRSLGRNSLRKGSCAKRALDYHYEVEKRRAEVNVNADRDVLEKNVENPTTAFEEE